MDPLTNTAAAGFLTMMFLPLIVMAWFYIAGTVLVAFVASQQGRNGLLWLMASVAISPVICLLALAGLPSKNR